jgi:hypothetical protein
MVINGFGLRRLLKVALRMMFTAKGTTTLLTDDY